MRYRRIALSLFAIAALASAAFASSPQRKTAGSSDQATPQTQMAAGAKPRLFVATSAENTQSWTNPITRQALENALVNSGRFEVVAGAQRDNLLKEQGFANSDVIDPNESIKVGRMLAARYVVSGTCQSVTVDSKSTGGLGGFGSKIGLSGNQELSSKVVAKVQIQMLDLESGSIVLSREYTEKGGESSMGTSSSSNREEAGYREIIDRVSQQFVAELGASVPIEALVVTVQNGRVALNKGAAAGVKADMKFEVYAEGEALKDPATGEVLSRTTTRYAMLRVVEVQEKLSWAEVLRTFNDAGTPDAAPDLSKIEAQMSAKSVPAGAGGAAGAGGGGGKKKKEKENN